MLRSTYADGMDRQIAERIAASEDIIGQPIMMLPMANRRVHAMWGYEAQAGGVAYAL
jgi:hypothetical protein